MYFQLYNNNKVAVYTPSFFSHSKIYSLDLPSLTAEVSVLAVFYFSDSLKTKRVIIAIRKIFLMIDAVSAEERSALD